MINPFMCVPRLVRSNENEQSFCIRRIILESANFYVVTANLYVQWIYVLLLGKNMVSHLFANYKMLYVYLLPCGFCGCEIEIYGYNMANSRCQTVIQ